MPIDYTQLKTHLWSAADELRANSRLRSYEYSGPVLGFIFLRYAGVKFSHAEAQLKAQSTNRRSRRQTAPHLDPARYYAAGVPYLPSEARFDTLLELPEGADLGQAINQAMQSIEQHNPELKGVLPQTYHHLENSTLSTLLKTFNNIPMAIEGDVFGKIYEYFLGQFAKAEGQRGGEFFTPTSLVKLIVEVIEPFHGKILDPACGSGGMFVQSANFVTRHQKNPGREISLYGQEKTEGTVGLAKMNLAINGLEGHVSQGNTYYEDLHRSVGQFDFVMANPPFNVNNVDKDRIKNDTARYPLGMPRVDNANYLWIQIFYSALNAHGRAGFVLAAMALFEELGWETTRAFEEAFTPAAATPSKPYLGRANRTEVVLRDPLHQALTRLNPDLPAEALDQALTELTRSRAAMPLARANQDIYHLLKNGVKVPYRDEHNEPQQVTVYLLDWQTPENNDFLLVSQLWVTGDMYTRRTDLVGFVNGLPLLFVELKASHRHVQHAYDDNLTDYKQAIPALLRYNGLVILSNGLDSRVGSVTAQWAHFAEWKRINTEGEQGLISLDTTLRATCPPARLLDLVENFTLFAESSSETDGAGLNKLVSKNHQYLGVNNAVNAVKKIAANQGRLGVFWHTQGSGKSYSMIFFAQKVLRKLPGNWTFVVITDRQELDGQIYKTFARAGVVTEPEKRVRAQSGEHLEQLLGQDHRYVFTLIHKFHTPPGAPLVG